MLSLLALDVGDPREVRGPRGAALPANRVRSSDAVLRKDGDRVSTLYEIINPSDAYTMVAEDRAVACAAVVFLGEGHYGLSAKDDEKDGCPILAWGGANALDEFFAKELGTTLADVMRDRRPAMAAALRSVAIGTFTDRESFDRGLALIDDPAKKEEWRAWWHDERRSSMNDIGARAWALADAMAVPA